jgi:hypothetical protein
MLFLFSIIESQPLSVRFISRFLHHRIGNVSTIGGIMGLAVQSRIVSESPFLSSCPP